MLLKSTLDMTSAAGRQMHACDETLACMHGSRCRSRTCGLPMHACDVCMSVYAIVPDNLPEENSALQPLRGHFFLRFRHLWQSGVRDAGKAAVCHCARWRMRTGRVFFFMFSALITATGADVLALTTTAAAAAAAAMSLEAAPVAD